MQDEDLAYVSAVELAAAVRNKSISPVEIVRAVFARIDRVNPQLNAYCTLLRDEAEADARRAEAAVMHGAKLGPLHGVPVSIKDLLAVKNQPLTFGSRLYERNVAQEDAPVVERLRSAGAILVGRTNTPEFGWKGVTDNRLFGVTHNPWNRELTPGGSSGGAGAAVAAGLGPIGIGTDGGGSLRIPAAFCAVVGYKPSFGRVPNYPASGVDALRHTGPLARTVADIALTLDALAGPDERDPASLPPSARDYLATLDRGIRGLRVAYSDNLGYARVDRELAAICAAAAKRFATAGAHVEEVDLTWHDPYDCWKVLFYGGLAARLHRFTADERQRQLDPGLYPLVETALKFRAVEYVNALVERNAFWQRVRALFERFDLLITPALAVPPFPVGRDAPELPTENESSTLRWSPFTYPFNLTGQPAICVPCGRTSADLPVGLQLVGRRFDDATVLRAAWAWEQIQPWAARRPQLE